MSEKTPEGKTDPAAKPAATGSAAKAKKPGAVMASDVRKKRQVAVGAVLAPLMQPALARQGVVLAQIAPHWRALCPLLAAHSSPESVKQDILTVAVASDGVKQELHYVTPQVIEGITRLLGYAAITKVRAITRHGSGVRDEVARRAGLASVPASAPATPAMRDKANGLCKSIADDDLRAALSRLGAEILKENEKIK